MLYKCPSHGFDDITRILFFKNGLQQQHIRHHTKKGGILELETNDALLGQSKLLTSNVEELTKKMAKIQQQLKAIQEERVKNSGRVTLPVKVAGVHIEKELLELGSSSNYNSVDQVNDKDMSNTSINIGEYNFTQYLLVIKIMDGKSAPVILGHPFIHKAQIKPDVDENTITIKDRDLVVYYNLLLRATHSTRNQGCKWMSSFEPS
ncbi:hypothetical protein MTR_7g025070 [Medicago truncatula]|uniref:Uncharacterized protein n=2 Tax=Medicago truncatula TaxID=3880 RepID=G7KXX6_MEDTR|nr:hypothetical protein MTR_7g025070 [Medicago truncatula]